MLKVEVTESNRLTTLRRKVESAEDREIERSMHIISTISVSSNALVSAEAHVELNRARVESKRYARKQLLGPIWTDSWRVGPVAKLSPHMIV